MVRSRQNQNAEEEVASIFHQNKIMKKSISKLKVAQIGPAKEGEERKLEVTDDPLRIEENLVAFFDSLLNGRMDKNMQDTGKKFEPDMTYLDKFFGESLQSVTAVTSDPRRRSIV